MGLEGDAFFGNLTKGGERKDLETARVGQDWAVPVLEVVQAAQLFHHVHTGAQHQVIGVAQDNRSIEAFQIFRTEGFHGCLRADGHEDGGGHGTVFGPQATQTGSALSILVKDFIGSDRRRCHSLFSDKGESL